MYTASEKWKYRVGESVDVLVRASYTISPGANERGRDASMISFKSNMPVDWLIINAYTAATDTFYFATVAINKV